MEYIYIRGSKSYRFLDLLITIVVIVLVSICVFGKLTNSSGDQREVVEESGQIEQGKKDSVYSTQE